MSNTCVDMALNKKYWLVSHQPIIFFMQCLISHVQLNGIDLVFLSYSFSDIILSYYQTQILSGYLKTFKI